MLRDEWLKLSTISGDKECPNCKNTSFDKIYICNENSRIGYMLFWCKSCMTGISISRVKAPVEAEIVPMSNVELVKEKTPDISLVN